MKLLFSLLVLGLALGASMEYHRSMMSMRRALANTVNYQTGSDTPFPPFDPKTVDGWDQMTQQEKDQV